MQPGPKARSIVGDPAPSAGAETLSRTLERLRQAREACRTADRARLLEALDILRTASAEFEAWAQQIRRGPAPAAGPLRSGLVRVKREVASFLRLVDACAAVERGLSARFGAAALAYSPNGCTTVSTFVPSAYDMQG
ncbi:MAG: hypothetical protein ABSH45_13065 [Bryobacteraceae bacterium]|jgi:hypothetical protein